MRKPKTQTAYVFWLKRFAEYNKCSIQTTLDWGLKRKGFVTDTDHNNAVRIESEDRMEDFKIHLQEEGLSGSSVKQAWTALKNWYRKNRIHIQTKCENVDDVKTYYDHIPTKEQLKLILEKADIRYKVAFSLIAFSGMRPVDVSNLRYKELSASLNRGDKVLTISVKQQKTGTPYITYLGPQGTMYVRAYFEKRMSEGERMTAESFVVSNRFGQRLTQKAMRDAFNRYLKKTTGKNPTGEYDRKFRLYGLRKYFKYSMKGMCEGESEYLMGHAKGLRSIPARYGGLADRDRQAIEDLKQNYIKNLPNLETDMNELSIGTKLELKVQILEQELMKFGISANNLREIYTENDIVGGGKAVKADWEPTIPLVDRDPLDDLNEEELDTLFIRALRKKLMSE